MEIIIIFNFQIYNLELTFRIFFSRNKNGLINRRQRRNSYKRRFRLNKWKSLRNFIISWNSQPTHPRDHSFRKRTFRHSSRNLNKTRRNRWYFRINKRKARRQNNKETLIFSEPRFLKVKSVIYPRFFTKFINDTRGHESLKIYLIMWYLFLQKFSN